MHNLASKKFGKDKQKWNKTCVLILVFSQGNFIACWEKKEVTFNFNLKKYFLNYEEIFNILFLFFIFIHKISMF